VPLGVIIAGPAIRLSTLFLAITTLGFGMVVEKLIFPMDFLFGSASDGVPMPRLQIGGFNLTADRPHYYLMLVLVALVATLTLTIRRARLGRLLSAMADSAPALSSLGLNVNGTRVLVFAISAFLAGLGGIMIGTTVNVATSEIFTTFLSLIYFTILTMTPFAAPWNAIFAAVPYAILPAYVGMDGGQTLYILNVVFGVFAILTALQGGPPEAPAWLSRLLSRKGKTEAPTEARSHAASRRNISSDIELNAQGISVRFGQLDAVVDASIHARAGSITGLIGPNGAGKTTLFNAIAGTVSARAGAIHLSGRDIRGLSVAARARAGIGRTFQKMELFESLTVEENVVMGAEAQMAGANVLRHLFAQRSELRVSHAHAREAIELVGLGHRLGTRVGDLSTGDRRRLELARCLAGDFDILLLDEPSSGLDGHETETFGKVLRHAVETRGIGILMIEHDMSLTMALCSHIYVMNAGRIVFDGAPQQVMDSPLVRSIYLGTANEEVVVHQAAAGGV